MASTEFCLIETVIRRLNDLLRRPPNPGLCTKLEVFFQQKRNFFALHIFQEAPILWTAAFFSNIFPLVH
ncbi:hypothetical protein SprV_0802575900 [Sparganum proliferum]